MSITPKALPRMRIISIPLTRPRAALKNTIQNEPAKRILTYYQFQITSPPRPSKSASTSEDGEDSWMSRWRPEGGVVKWVTTKAADTWAGFGKEKAGWKLKTYQAGERLVDRMDFEELALKGIDPSLGPQVTQPDPSEKEAKHTGHPTTTIPLVYPSSISSGTSTLEELRALVAYRTPRHRRGFIGWMLFAPVTAPFMIIPVIPNLPFFFCVWRSWSHYKAYRASQYLQSLLDRGVIVPEASPALDLVYKDYAPESSSPEKISPENGNSHLNPSSNSNPSTNPDPKPPPSAHHTLLLTHDAVPAIISFFGLKPSALADLQRAVEQARVRVGSGRKVL